uniref:Uncharacterized protein n=1 Tax=Panagrellus redivivus TaxID=6233 RepID=A0A7E4VCF8_PANRE
MSAKKNNEEEIERQYREYKAQFDQWKEANKQAIGTEAYNRYVEQFQTWERDVEKRRAANRKNKAEEKGDNDDAAAQAYAAQQEHYLRMHQKGMAEDAMRNRLTAGQARSTPGDFSNMVNSLQNVIHSAIKSSENRSPADALKPAPVGGATISAPPLMHAQQAPAVAIQAQQVEATRPPQLWWTRQPDYGPQDKLHRIFGPRAAPTTTNLPVAENYFNYQPGWLVQRDMAQNNLVFPGALPMPLRLLHPSKTDPPRRVPPADAPFPNPQADFSVPPPTFNVSVPPPILQPALAAVPPANIPPPVLPFNPMVPPPIMPALSGIQAGMKRNHSFPGRHDMMQIPQRG